MLDRPSLQCESIDLGIAAKVSQAKGWRKVILKNSDGATGMLSMLQKPEVVMVELDCPKK